VFCSEDKKSNICLKVSWRNCKRQWHSVLKKKLNIQEQWDKVFKEDNNPDIQRDDVINWIQDLMTEMCAAEESVHHVDLGMNPEPMLILHVT
jgi:hypothetical protein